MSHLSKLIFDTSMRRSGKGKSGIMVRDEVCSGLIHDQLFFSHNFLKERQTIFNQSIMCFYSDRELRWPHGERSQQESLGCSLRLPLKTGQGSKVKNFQSMYIAIEYTVDYWPKSWSSHL